MRVFDEDESKIVESWCDSPVESVTERDFTSDRVSSDGRAFKAGSPFAVVVVVSVAIMDEEF